jgi:shikimate kinase
VRGVGTAHAAITIVNALPAGIGCAVGITLPVIAEVRMEPSPTAQWTVDGELDNRLIRESLASAVDRLGGGRQYAVELRLRSEIPPSKGLKSSSAVPVAIARAIADALGESISPMTVAQLAADVGWAAGLSATGAFDDALAGAAGGFVVTDNTRRIVRRHERPPGSWGAVLWIPPGSHRPSPEWQDAFARDVADVEAAVNDSLSGAYLRAMGRNTRRVERVMGYEYAAIHASLRTAGALASGVTGMGPAVAAVVERDEHQRVLDALPPSSGERRYLDLLPLEGRPIAGST